MLLDGTGIVCYGGNNNNAIINPVQLMMLLRENLRKINPMRPSVFLTVTIGLLLASLLSADAESVRNKLATDTAKIETLKQHKIVREDQRGVLITESRDPEIIQLVNEENVIRQKQYQEVIKQKCLEKWPQNRRMRNNCIEEMLQNK